MKVTRLQCCLLFVVVFAMVVVTIIGSAIEPEKKFNGFYTNEEQLVLSTDPKAYHPCQLETGNHWMVWLSAIQEHSDFLLSTEKTKQTIVAIEFISLPPLDENIDLASVPLQAVYEYGGQRTLYASYSVTGTLRIHKNPDNTYSIAMNATFYSPLLGNGEQQVNVAMLLRKRPQPIFY